MNLLHDIAPGTKEEMNVVIEIPRGSQNKYEIDKKTGLIALDRVLHTTVPLAPGILVRARPVAIMPMIDDGDPDEKVIAVPADDPRFASIKELKDVNAHTLKEIAHFFVTYKKLQDKEVSIGEYEGAGEAQAAFERACKMYKENPKGAA